MQFHLGLEYANHQFVFVFVFIVLSFFTEVVVLSMVHSVDIIHTSLLILLYLVVVVVAVIVAAAATCYVYFSLSPPI